MTWIPKKTRRQKIKRQGVITKDTYKLVKKLAEGKDPHTKLYASTENNMKSALSYLFRVRLKVAVSSHDFRHSKVTDLSQVMGVKDI